MRKQTKGLRRFPEEMLAHSFFGGFYIIRKLLVFGELTNEVKYERNVALRCRQYLQLL